MDDRITRGASSAASNPAVEARRRERGDLIAAGHRSQTDWREPFNDDAVAAAMLDRLLHHETTLGIRAEGCRLRDTREAGLLGRRPKPTSEEVTGSAEAR